MDTSTSSDPPKQDWVPLFLKKLDAAEGNLSCAARATPINFATVRARRRRDKAFAAALRQILNRHQDPDRPWAPSKGSFAASQLGGRLGARKTNSRRQRARSAGERRS